MSPHALARAFVEHILHSGGSLVQILSLQEEISIVRRQLADLRTDLSVSTAVLLVSAGRTNSEAAKDWIEKNLNRE